jgi:hypothetical protein
VALQVPHRLYGRWISAILTAVLAAACQPAAAPLATTAPSATAPPSATSTALPPTATPTHTDIPATATLVATATQSPTPRPTIPTPDFAPGDVLGTWMRSDPDRGDLYITFRQDGTYQAAHGTPEGVVHGGKYTLDGRLLTYVDGWDCSPKPRDTPGPYVLRIQDGGRFLYMSRYGDTCPDRPQALANFRWMRLLATPTPVP